MREEEENECLMGVKRYPKTRWFYTINLATFRAPPGRLPWSDGQHCTHKERIEAGDKETSKHSSSYGGAFSSPLFDL